MSLSVRVFEVILMSWIILEQEQIFYSFISHLGDWHTCPVPFLLCFFVVQFPFITSGDRWFCYSCLGFCPLPLGRFRKPRKTIQYNSSMDFLLENVFNIIFK